MRLAALVASGKLTCQAAKICSPFGRCIYYIYIYNVFPNSTSLKYPNFSSLKTGRHLEGPSSLIRKGVALIPKNPFTPQKTNMKSTSLKLWKMILPLHFGMIFRFQPLVFLEVSNFSGSQHQTLWWYQIYFTSWLEQIEKKKSTKKINFFTSKTSFQLFAPPKLRTFFVSPQKKTKPPKHTGGAFHCQDCAGENSAFPKIPWDNLFCWEVFSILFVEGQSFLRGHYDRRINKPF